MQLTDIFNLSLVGRAKETPSRSAIRKTISHLGLSDYSDNFFNSGDFADYKFSFSRADDFRHWLFARADGYSGLFHLEASRSAGFGD